jgi:hypothetical protein
MAVRVPPPPNLPNGPETYLRQYQDQLNNVLRLYFNQLNNLNQSITASNGGGLLSFPYVAASDNNTQYASGNNTATIVQWNTLDSGNAFTLNSNNTATALVSGIYKITYSLQFANNNNTAHDAIVWLRVDGTSATSLNDIADSTTIFTLPARKSAGVPSYACGYSEVVFTLTAGDSVGLWWGTDQAATSGGTTGVYIYAQAAQTSPMAYPATPSALGSITFVSALPT